MLTTFGSDMNEAPMRIAVFASGRGSNAANLADYFSDHPLARVSMIVTNNPHAGVMEVAAKKGLPVLVISPKDVINMEVIVDLLKKEGINVVLLVGYLKLVPEVFIRAFEGRIANLHPALLPRHGGPGMYGSRVHRAVKEAGDEKSGITLHHVSSEYDSGLIIAQFETEINSNDSESDIEAKVRALEVTYLPTAVETWLKTI